MPKRGSVWMNPIDLTYTASRSLLAIASRYSSNSNCMLKSVWLKCSNKTRLFAYRPKITGPYLAYPISHLCTQDLVVFWLTVLKIIVGLGIQSVVTASFSPCRLQFSNFRSRKILWFVPQFLKWRSNELCTTAKLFSSYSWQSFSRINKINRKELHVAHEDDIFQLSRLVMLHFLLVEILVVVKTLNLEISRCHLADYVKELY